MTQWAEVVQLKAGMGGGGAGWNSFVGCRDSNSWASPAASQDCRQAGNGVEVRGARALVGTPLWDVGCPPKLKQLCQNTYAKKGFTFYF